MVTEIANEGLTHTCGLHVVLSGQYRLDNELLQGITQSFGQKQKAAAVNEVTKGSFQFSKTC